MIRILLLLLLLLPAVHNVHNTVGFTPIIITINSMSISITTCAMNRHSIIIINIPMYHRVRGGGRGGGGGGNRCEFSAKEHSDNIFCF